MQPGRRRLLLLLLLTAPSSNSEPPPPPLPIFRCALAPSAHLHGGDVQPPPSLIIFAASCSSLLLSSDQPNFFADDKQFQRKTYHPTYPKVVF